MQFNNNGCRSVVGRARADRRTALSLLLPTWQPVTDIAIAISVPAERSPERPRRLTGC
jgi:hypothetical protein